MQLQNEVDRICTACWSDCGTFLSIRNHLGFLVYPPWRLSPKCLGHIAVQHSLRTLYPGRVLHVTSLGAEALFLRAHNRDGRFFLEVGNTETRTRKILFEQVLPSYLVDVNPIVVFDNVERPQIYLVFLCGDRGPEVMVIPSTWTQLVEKCIEKASRHLLKGSNEKIESLGQLLDLEKQWVREHRLLLS